MLSSYYPNNQLTWPANQTYLKDEFWIGSCHFFNINTPLGAAHYHRAIVGPVHQNSQVGLSRNVQGLSNHHLAQEWKVQLPWHQTDWTSMPRDKKQTALFPGSWRAPRQCSEGWGFYVSAHGLPSPPQLIFSQCSSDRCLLCLRKPSHSHLGPSFWWLSFEENSRDTVVLIWHTNSTYIYIYIITLAFLGCQW